MAAEPNPYTSSAPAAFSTRAAWSISPPMFAAIALSPMMPIAAGHATPMDYTIRTVNQ